MNRRVLIASIAVSTALIVSACSLQVSSQAMSTEIKMTVVGLPDGRGLTCAVYAPNSDIGTIDCDWAHASESVKPDPDTPLATKIVAAPDGRAVMCAIYAATSNSGAISCGWPDR